MEMTHSPANKVKNKLYLNTEPNNNKSSNILIPKVDLDEVHSILAEIHSNDKLEHLMHRNNTRRSLVKDHDSFVH